MTAAAPDRWVAPNYASFTGSDAIPLQQTFQSLSKYLQKINNSVTIANGVGVLSAVAGTGISVSSATGAVTFTNTGVTSLTGTTNQITVSVSTGAATLSLPNDISISGTFNAGSNATMNTSGFYVVGSTTLNRSGSVGFTTAGAINFQQDGTTQATIGSNNASYGNIAMSNGTRGGYMGINFGGSNTAGTPHLMFSSDGSGGQYHYGNWATYWSQTNLCLGIGDSVTTSGVKCQINGAIKSTLLMDCGGRYRGTWTNSGADVQMSSGNSTHWHWDGTYRMYVDTTNVKNFTIQHPNKSDSWLVHACAEGATADVFYRGEAQLKAGICAVILPDYFEALTETEGRSVMLTPIADEHGMVANLAAYKIEDGQFLVEQIGGYHVPDQRFWWRVDAVRKNTRFSVEPEKSSVTVHGMGPYTYIESNA